MTVIPSHILAHIEFLTANMAEETDWLTVKKQLLRVLKPRDRKNFTTRDQLTKRHMPFNPFERAIREHWQQLTGNILEMPLDKRLDDVDPGGYL